MKTNGGCSYITDFPACQQKESLKKDSFCFTVSPWARARDVCSNILPLKSRQAGVPKLSANVVSGYSFEDPVISELNRF